MVNKAKQFNTTGVIAATAFDGDESGDEGEHEELAALAWPTTPASSEAELRMPSPPTTTVFLTPSQLTPDTARVARLYEPTPAAAQLVRSVHKSAVKSALEQSAAAGSRTVSHTPASPIESDIAASGTIDADANAGTDVAAGDATQDAASSSGSAAPSEPQAEPTVDARK